MELSGKRVLLIDFDDARRGTRVTLLKSAGHEVDTERDYIGAGNFHEEASYDLVILALHAEPDKAASYSDRLARVYPGLPILLLTDYGVLVPRGTLSRSLASGNPLALMQQVASMLAGSTYIREIAPSPER